MIFEEVIEAVLNNLNGPVAVEEIANTIVIGYFPNLDTLTLKIKSTSLPVLRGKKEVTFNLLKAIMEENAKLRPQFKVPEIIIDY